MDLLGRSLLRDADLTPDEFLYLVDPSSQCRQLKQMGFQRRRK